MELLLGEVVATFGIKGALKIYSATQFAEKRYKKGNKVILCDKKGGNKVEVTVSNYVNQGRVDVLTFKEFNDINLVEKYIGYSVIVDEKVKDLPESTYYFYELTGCKVMHNDVLIGEVSEVLEYVNQNALRIKREGKKDILYPFIDKFLKNVDIANKVIEIEPIGGMLDD